jgi:DNA-binding response OmpR family regulator
MTPEASGNLLVVDDTPSKRYVLASWLRRAGYSVEEAATGAEALTRFRLGGIDLVVLDVFLPDRSGFEICEEMKADPDYGNTPVIHVSATAIESIDRTEGLERGADAYLVEPIDPDEFLATVASVLRYYQALVRAEKLAERLGTLARVTVAMGAARSQQELLDVAVAGAASIFSAPAALVTTRPDGGKIVAVTDGPGEPVQIRAWSREVPEAPIGVSYHDYPADGWPASLWPATGTLRVLGIRNRPDRPSLHIIVPTGATLPGAPVLTLFGQAVMSTMTAMSLYVEEHDVALTLQRSLLPARVPQVPEFELAVRYEPAIQSAEVGGDFYEVTRLGEHLMVAVGDVGGHSLQAATIMAEVRHATRAYLVEGHGPAAIVDRLNHLMAELIPGQIATLCLFAVEIATGRTRLANAGHPPPILRTQDGVRLITEHSPLLGIRAHSASEVEFTLAPGDTLVLYTDGLIETRGETLDRSLERLAKAVDSVEADLETFASRLLADVGPDEAGDDIAMVVMRRMSR